MNPSPRVSLDADAAELRLEFEDRETLTAFAASLIEKRGFRAPLKRELPQQHPVRAHLVLADRLDFVLAAEVTQRFDSITGDVVTAFALSNWGEQEAARLRRELGLAAESERAPARSAESEAPDPASNEAHDEVTRAAESVDDQPDAGETRGTSAIHEIRSMNVNQKTMLARRAGRAERQILLRETSPQVAMALLANPRLEGKDVVRLVKSTHATAALLQRIAEDPRWGKNQEILANVARNPKTPPPLAARLIDRLRTSDLRTMAKMSSGLREAVRRAALREYLRRTSK